MRRIATACLLLGLTAGAPTARTEQFFPIDQVDLMPPSLENWYYYFLKQQLKKSPCADCRWEVGIIPESIHYLPCPPEQPCGVAVHRSYQGAYGIFHPGPYYIQAPQRVMLPKGWMAPPEATPDSPEIPTVPQTPTLIRHIEKD